MNEINEYTEYRGLSAIAIRLACGIAAVKSLIHRTKDPLPVKMVGKKYWTTEYLIRLWLNNQDNK